MSQIFSNLLNSAEHRIILSAGTLRASNITERAVVLCMVCKLTGLGPSGQSVVEGVCVWFEKTDFALEETKNMQTTD